MKLRKWFYNPHGFAGRAFFGEFISFSHGGYALEQREVCFRVGNFYLSFVLGAFVWFDHYRTLANGDRVPMSEVIAPDDYRNQPLRPNGLPWDIDDGIIPF